jgi:hypothetical protein
MPPTGNSHSIFVAAAVVVVVIDEQQRAPSHLGLLELMRVNVGLGLRASPQKIVLVKSSKNLKRQKKKKINEVSSLVLTVR